MKKHIGLLFLFFVLHFASISLAHSQSNSKETKRELKKILVTAKKLNLNNIPDSLKSIFKEGLKTKIDNYFIEKFSDKTFDDENEYNKYLEETLAPNLAHKIYRSLLRDTIYKNGKDRKIINKTKKTSVELNNLYKAEQSVAQFLLEGTIILLSVLDKEEYKYIKIFLEELQLIATLPHSYPCIRLAFSKTVSGMQKLKEFFLEAWNYCDQQCKEIWFIDTKDE